MIPAAHRSHYLAVTAGMLLNEAHGLQGAAAARIIALAEQIHEIAGTLRGELTEEQPNAGSNTLPDEPTEATTAGYGGNVVLLPLPMNRLRG